MQGHDWAPVAVDDVADALVPLVQGRLLPNYDAILDTFLLLLLKSPCPAKLVTMEKPIFFAQ